MFIDTGVRHVIFHRVRALNIFFLQQCMNSLGRNIDFYCIKVEFVNMAVMLMRKNASEIQLM